MVGPVLYLELLLGSRRGRQYIFRWLYAGWLLLQLSFYYFLYRVSQVGPGELSASEFAGSFLELFVVQQMFLIVLATPAFVAGAITDEKTTGTLQYLLTADLTAPEIIVGKLLGRVAQVGLLVLVGLPVLCFIGVFGGLDLVSLLALTAVTALALFALGAATVLASVWCRQTRDAVLGLYVIGALGYFIFRGIHAWHLAPAAAAGGPGAGLVGRLDGLLEYFNPLYVLEPAWGLGNMAEFGRRLLGATLAWGSVAAVCIGLAVWRLHAAYIRQLENSGKNKKDRWWRVSRKEIRTDPIRWKERQVEGIAPLAALRRIPGWLGILGVLTLTVLSSGFIIWENLPPGVTLGNLVRLVTQWDVQGLAGVIDQIRAGEAFFWQGLVVMLLASLVVGIRCSGAVSGERERQTWEALLLTPLETRQLIRGKLWGIIGASYPYLRAYAVPAFLLSLLGSPLAVFWTVVWLAITWLAMFFVGAAGIWCSVKARTSWRSLLGTLGIGYVGGFVLFLCTSPVILILAWILVIIIALAGELLGLFSAGGAFAAFSHFGLAFRIASMLALAGMFLGMAFYFLVTAEKRVGSLERTRHWGDEPLFRRRSRRRVAGSRN